MENNNKTTNRNASASAFGWDFQINSAILLMIDNIEDVSYVKVEGKYEDIELYLNNGKTIYAQAKSFQDLCNIGAVLRDYSPLQPFYQSVVRQLQV